MHLSSVEKKETVQSNNEVDNGNNAKVVETPINRAIIDTEEKEEEFITEEDEEK